MKKMLFKVCVFIKLLCVQITLSQVLHHNLYYPSPTATRRCIRQINNSPVSSNGLPVNNWPNLPCGNDLPNANIKIQNSNNMPNQFINTRAIDRLMIQNGNNINGYGLLLNNMPAPNHIANYNNLPIRNDLPCSNNIIQNDVSFGNNIPMSNTIPNRNNQQSINELQNFNNILAVNGLVNKIGPANYLPNINRVSFANTIQRTLPPTSAHQVSTRSCNSAHSQNFPVNNIANDNNIFTPNRMANLPQNNLPIANEVQNQFHLNQFLPANNMFVSNGVNSLPQNNRAAIGNACNIPFANNLPINNCLQNGMPNNLLTNEGAQGLSNFKMEHGIASNNNGLPITNQNIPIINTVKNYVPQGNDINNPFTINGNIQQHTIVPNVNSMPINVLNNNLGSCVNGVSAIAESNFGDGIPKGLPINNGPLFASTQFPSNVAFANNFPVNLPITNNSPISYNLPISNNLLISNTMPISNNLPTINNLPISNNMPISNNLPISNNMPISNNLPILHNLPISNNMPILNNWPYDYTFANLPIKNNAFQNILPELSNLHFANQPVINNLQIEGFGNWPLLNGLPIAGITETVTVLNNPL